MQTVTWNFYPLWYLLPIICAPCANCYMEFLPPVLTVAYNLCPLCKLLHRNCAPFANYYREFYPPWANCYLDFVPLGLLLPRISAPCASTLSRWELTRVRLSPCVIALINITSNNNNRDIITNEIDSNNCDQI